MNLIPSQCLVIPPMRHVKKNEATIPPSWPNKHLIIWPTRPFSRGASAGGPVRGPGSQSEHSFRFIMFARDSCWSPVLHRVYIGLLFLLLIMSKKRISMMLMTILNIMLPIMMCVILRLLITPTLGHLRVAWNLCFKARLNAKTLIWKCFYSHANKTHFHNKGFALGLVLKMELLTPVVRNPPDKSLSTGYSLDIAIHRLNSWRLIFSRGLKWFFSRI